jgi:hypothetical protein
MEPQEPTVGESTVSPRTYDGSTSEQNDGDHSTADQSVRERSQQIRHGDHARRRRHFGGRPGHGHCTSRWTSARWAALSHRGGWRRNSMASSIDPAKFAVVMTCGVRPVMGCRLTATTSPSTQIVST